MGEIYSPPVCYDQVAKREGKKAAQALWKQNGWSGKYVPGYPAIKGFAVRDNIVADERYHCGSLNSPVLNPDPKVSEGIEFTKRVDELMAKSPSNRRKS